MASLDDVVADLQPVVDRLSAYASPNRAVTPDLDSGQRLMLAEAWRRVDQVLTEIERDAATVLNELDGADDVVEHERAR